MATYSVITNFQTTLGQGMTATQATCVLSTVTVQGHAISNADYGVFLYITLNPGAANMEVVRATSNSGTTFTLDKRGLAWYGASVVELSAYKFSHNAGEPVVISNVKDVYEELVDKVSDETVGGVKTFTSLPTIPVLPLVNTDAASKKYVDDTAVSGAPNASTGTKGIVQIATQAQNNAGTLTGSTGALLVATPDVEAITVQNAKWTFAADAQVTDAYAITLAPAITAYVTGQVFTFSANTQNTGAASLNVNGLGPITIKKNHDQDLETADIEAGSIVLVTYDGTNFQMLNQQASMASTAALSTIGRVADVQSFASNGTWTKVTGASVVEVVCIGAGGGGGSGRLGTGANVKSGGSGGGGGAVSRAIFLGSNLGATETVTVGVGGTGGAAISGSNADGNVGGNGTLSSFGTWLHAGGGGGGLAGIDSSGGAVRGGSGGGAISSASGASAGLPASAAGTNAIGSQGASSDTNGDGIDSEYGGASGGSADSTGGNNSGLGGSSVFSGPGGGGGGGTTAAPAEVVGKAGGSCQSYTAGGGGAAGAVRTAGTAGQANTVSLKGYSGQGGGGGGGSTSTSTSAGTGGNGGLPGGGGGGGGGGTGGGAATSGAGGNGGNGLVRVYSYF